MKNYFTDPNTTVLASGTQNSKKTIIESIYSRFSRVLWRDFILSTAYTGMGFMVLPGGSFCPKIESRFHLPSEYTCHMPHNHENEVPKGSLIHTFTSPHADVGTVIQATGTFNSKDVSLFTLNHNHHVEYLIIKTKG